MDNAFSCCWLPVFVDDEKASFKKVTTQSNWFFISLNEESWVLTLWLCLCVRCVIFSKSWLQWTHREEYVSWPLRMCIMLAIYFFSPFPPSGHNGFCVSLLKSSRIWTFSWHLLLRKHWQKWLAYWEQPALRDEESVWFAEGLKTIMRTRALNKWILMKCSHQDNTVLRVLHPGCSVQVRGGSQRNFNPYLTVTAIFTTKIARNKDRKTNIKQRKVALLLCHHQKHQHHRYTSFFVKQLNWDIKYCYFPLLWRAGGPCCGLVGQHPGKGPQETSACVVCVHVCVRACVIVNHSRMPPIITLSERAVGRNWRRGPQLSQGLAGGPQWLVAFPHTHIHAQTLAQGTHMTLLDTLWTHKKAWIHKKTQRTHRSLYCQRSSYSMG